MFYLPAMGAREHAQEPDQALRPFVALFDEHGTAQGWTTAPVAGGVAIGAADPGGRAIGDILPEITAERWAEVWQSVVHEGGFERLCFGLPGSSNGALQLIDVEVCKFVDRGTPLAKVEVREASGANAKLSLLQQEMLEAIANGISLPELMELLCRRAEAFAPSAICSVLTIDSEGRLQHLASPSLPDHYSEAVNGVAIGPKVGSCGTAAFRGEPVEVTDIATDPLWEDYKALALPLGLRACWSSPIKSSSGRVLGAFAFYFSEPRGPSPIEREIVTACVHLCAIALEHEEARLRIYQLAFSDSLTGLDNRIRCQQRLSEVLRLIGETRQRAAVLCIGLDQFHAVNDTMGHAAGDEILRTVAERLKQLTKEGDIVARLGGDEFAVVQVGGLEATEVADFARKIIDEIEKPHELHGQNHVVQASVGIAFAPDDATRADELMKNAALALHRVKGRGRRTYQFYEKGLNALMQKRRRLEVDLRKALTAGEFELYFQPIVAVESMEVVRAEGLLRWHHPERGMVMPAEFIPVAEDTGLIVPLGAWAVEQACAAVAGWPEHVEVAVNLSPVQFESPGLFEMIAKALSKYGVRPSRLQIEITESILLRDSAVNIALLDKLNDLGVSLALDDFGTGYSSLSYLRRFAFDKIKIDRSFVQGMCQSSEARKIVRSIVMLAHSLGLTVTVEGVETDEQFAAVRGEGCDEVQGYYVARPLPLKAFQKLLGGSRPRRRQAKTAS